MNELARLYEQFDPARPLRADEGQLYVDWQKDLGFDDLKIRLTNSIALSQSTATFRLLTGHRGVGKTTELNRVKDILMSGGAPRKLFVSFVEGEKWFDLSDVDAPDIVFQMVRQLVADLKERGYSVGWDKFAGFFQEFQEILNADVELKSVKIPAGIAEFGVVLKDVAQARAHLRKLLEGQLPTIYDLINREVLTQAKQWLKQDKGYDDILIIVDEMDRISETTVQERVFLEKAGLLRALNCHILYTIPIDLAYSLANQKLKQQFEEVLVLPVIPVFDRGGQLNEDAERALEQVVEKRCRDAEVPLDRFLDQALLERLCRLSGGHVRNLFILLRGAITRSTELPVENHAVNVAVRRQATDLIRPLLAKHRKVLDTVYRTKQPVAEDLELWYELLRNHYVYAYEDADGPWYDVNPLYHELPVLSQGD